MKIETIMKDIQCEINDKQDVDKFDIESNCGQIMDVFKHYDVQLSDYQQIRITRDLQLIVADQMKEDMSNTINDISTRVDNIEFN